VEYCLDPELAGAAALMPHLDLNDLRLLGQAWEMRQRERHHPGSVQRDGGVEDDPSLHRPGG
jgi:hypothetical protein